MPPRSRKTVRTSRQWGGESATAEERYGNDSAIDPAEVAKHEKEMMEIGAEVKGEGAIE